MIMMFKFSFLKIYIWYWFDNPYFNNLRIIALKTELVFQNLFNLTIDVSVNALENPIKKTKKQSIKFWGFSKGAAC